MSEASINVYLTIRPMRAQAEPIRAAVEKAADEIRTAIAATGIYSRVDVEVEGLTPIEDLVGS